MRYLRKERDSKFKQHPRRKACSSYSGGTVSGKKLFLSFFVFLTITAISWAQTTGGIRGVINDDEGKALPGAVVTVSSTALIGSTRTTTSNEVGVFRFPSLPVGAYSLEASMEGFETVRAESIKVGLNATANVPLIMRLSSMSESLTVVGETPVIDVTDSGVSTTYNKEILEYVPTQGTFTDLMQVAPGVSASTGDSQGDRTVAFGSNQQSNSWNVDGLETTAPETGSTWLYQNPDSIEEIQILGVGAPAEYGNHTGAVFNVVTKKGGNVFHGGANYFFQDGALTGVNVNDSNFLCPPGQECDHYNRVTYNNVTAQIGGPIKREALWFFGSFQYLRDASTEPGVPPAIATEEKSTRYDFKVSGMIGKKSEFTAFYQQEDWASPDGASPFVAPSAVYEESGDNWAWGGGITSTLTDNTLLEAHYAGWSTHDLQQSPTGSLDAYFINYLPPDGGPPLYSGGSYYPFDYRTGRSQVNGKVTHYAENFLNSQHEFRFGVQFSRGHAITDATSAGANGFYEYNGYGYNYGTYDYQTNLYRSYQLPFQYGAITKDLGFFLDDTINIGDRLTLNVGVRYDHNTGDMPEFQQLVVGTPSFTSVGNFIETGETVPGFDVMTWNTVSPRLGFVWQTRADGRSALQGSFGVYYDHNVSGNWDWPSPSVTPFQTFQFNPVTDAFDIPWFEQNYALSLNPDIKPPRTLQYSVGYDHQFNETMAVGVQYVYKDTTDLIGWEIIGGEWEQVLFVDPFTGNQYTLLSEIVSPIVRKGNAPFPNGIPNFSGDTEPYFQKYQGVLLTFTKNFANNWALNASYTWSKSEGLIPRMLAQVQFNPFYGSREGSDPNQYVNAEGLLQGDRPNMFRVQGIFNNLPWGIQLATAVDFSSGRPHTRLYRVPSTATPGGVLAQGSTNVIMERGFRLEPIEAIDVTIGKVFNVGSDVQFRLEGTIYNLLNSGNDLNLATLLLSEPGEEFVPDTWAKPIRLQLRFGVQF